MELPRGWEHLLAAELEPFDVLLGGNCGVPRRRLRLTVVTVVAPRRPGRRRRDRTLVQRSWHGFRAPNSRKETLSRGVGCSGPPSTYHTYTHLL